MLGVPGVIKTGCGSVVDGMCGLTILLYSLAYPCTLKHVRLVFGLSPLRISEAYRVYGDPAYGSSQHLSTPYKATSVAALTPQMCEFNQRMSAYVDCPSSRPSERYRVCGLSATISPSKRAFSVFCSYPVHSVSVFLINLHTCLNGGNQISDYFGMKLPTPEQ